MNKNYFISIFKTVRIGCILVLILFNTNLPAQPQLWSVCASGGSNSTGTIFKIDPDGSAYNRRFDFPSPTTGTYPISRMLLAANGKIYGITSAGGQYNTGTIFTYNPSTDSVVQIFQFDSIDFFIPHFANVKGSSPSGGLIEGANGKLYGAVAIGGSHGGGVLYSLDTLTGSYSKLFDFDTTNGSNPNGELFLAANGLIYGVTTSGGAHNDGVIFSFDTATSTYVKLFDFYSSINGSGAIGHLIQATDGKLYGTARTGGYLNGGVLFSYDILSNTFSDLVDFDFNNDSKGANPGSLIQASNGKLYGMTNISGPGGNSGGVIFSYNIANNQYDSLYYFLCALGCEPTGSLMQFTDGKLYGTTSSGGSINSGVVFSIDTLGQNYSSLHDFLPTTYGYVNENAFIHDGQGNMYCYAGGGIVDGVICKFRPADSTLTTLFNFGISEGNSPSGSLLSASNGKLYGMARGGINNRGIIYSFNPSTNQFLNLFDAGDYLSGKHVGYGALIEGPNGLLYGMGEYSDVTSSYHYVYFSFDNVTNTYTSLYDGSGGEPSPDIYLASNNKIYGAYMDQYCCNTGRLFHYNLVLNSVYNDHVFTSSEGTSPSGRLVEDFNGYLFGTASGGGNTGCGTIFKLDTFASYFNKVFDFDTLSGITPTGLIKASDSCFYGMTSLGGIYGNGVIFKFKPTDSTYTKLYDFDQVNGSNPEGRLFQSSNGKLYGMTAHGGIYNDGVIFSFDPLNNLFSKLKDLTTPDGIIPTVSFIEINSPVGVHQIKSQESHFIVYPNPASNYFTIKMNDAKPLEKRKLEICNSIGQCIISTMISGPEKTISTNQLFPGTYIIKITANDKVSSQLLMIY